MPERETIYEVLQKRGVTRRDFLKMTILLTGALGLEYSQVERVRVALETKPRVPVIWLEFQDCAGCTESISRSQNPTLTSLVLNDLTIEYHETLMAAAGFQAEGAKEAAMEQYYGEYVLVVEGSIPQGAGGVYCTVGGRTALDILRETAEGAFAVIAVGNCASFGGLPKASPNPTDAVGVMELVTDKPVINIPGCPAIPEAMTNTIAHIIALGSIPELDYLKRPMAFYSHTIHDRCLRRGFYEAGLFADSFGDEGYRKGYCLYKLGCKGPTTYNACSSLKWNGGTSFPVESGHPCLGCSEPNFWDNGGFYQGQSAPLQRPEVSVVGIAAGAGVVLGAGAAALNASAKKKAREQAKAASHQKEEEKEE
ncbi:MAG TPA: uptake hydrogenase small subunit [Chloroflexi bacterium]|nr:uptake hydrogenase small subunit [Chloroflexota bacterium]